MKQRRFVGQLGGVGATDGGSRGRGRLGTRLLAPRRCRPARRGSPVQPSVLPELPGPPRSSPPSSPPDSEAQQAAAGAMGAMGGTPENVEPP